MLKFLQQPAYLPAQTGPEADARYKRMRLQVFLGVQQRNTKLNVLEIQDKMG